MESAPAITAETIARALRGVRYRGGDESRLHGAVAELLKSKEVAFAREVRLGDKNRDRIDFTALDRIGIECKVAGSCTEVVSQLLRYAEAQELDAIVLVTSHASLRKLGSRRTLAGKPFYVVYVGFAGL